MTVHEEAGSHQTQICQRLDLGFRATKTVRNTFPFYMIHPACEPKWTKTQIIYLFLPYHIRQSFVFRKYLILKRQQLKEKCLHGVKRSLFRCSAILLCYLSFYLMNKYLLCPYSLGHIVLFCGYKTQLDYNPCLKQLRVGEEGRCIHQRSQCNVIHAIFQIRREWWKIMEVME